MWPIAVQAQDDIATATSAAAEPNDSEGDFVPLGVVYDYEITVLANGDANRLFQTENRSRSSCARISTRCRVPDLTRVLERAPGVVFSRNGGPGSFTGVRVRGAEGEQLLVLLDGVRVADTASPGGGFDFGNLLMGNLAKVELQRSSNSTIWGSQALGGVLAATTGSSDTVSGSLEYGTHDSVYATGGARLEAGPATFNVQAGHYTTDGFSAAAGGTEADGFRQTELAGRAEVTLVEGFTAFATGRMADGRLEIDGFPAPAFTLADTDEYQETRQRSGAAGGALRGQRPADLGDGLARRHRARQLRSRFGSAPGYTTDGESERAELRGRWRFANELALDFGAEKEWQRFSSLFDPLHKTAIGGGYAQIDYDGAEPASRSRPSPRRASRLRRCVELRRRCRVGARSGPPYGVLRRRVQGTDAVPASFGLRQRRAHARDEPQLRCQRRLQLRPGHCAVDSVSARHRGLIGFVSCFGVTTGSAPAARSARTTMSGRRGRRVWRRKAMSASAARSRGPWPTPCSTPRTARRARRPKATTLRAGLSMR
jgi:vitamin B12 transporter